MGYTVSKEFNSQHAKTLLVACSSDHFTEQTAEFLHNCLDIERYDEYLVPGGALVLTSSWAYIDEKRLKFLIQAHAIERVIIIAHENCDAYNERFSNLSQEAIKRLQEKDLKGGKQKLNRYFPAVKIELYFASVYAGKVTFETVE